MAAMLGHNLALGDHLCWKCANLIQKDIIGDHENVDHAMDVDQAPFIETVTGTQVFSDESSEDPSDTSDSDVDYIDKEVAEEKLKVIRNVLCIPGFKKSEAFLENDVDFAHDLAKGCRDCHELVDQLVASKEAADTVAEQYKCMTSTPQWVSLSKIQTKFKVSKGIAVKVSKLRKQWGQCQLHHLD
ncbi:unnamed protein product [Allacma fusca]|uniref:Uncharacterized protein n=1 Tax=Allacma fusca TaxID=39272 RepID=A0A8J2K7U4_9HEXA|nr:unnamed protein product [Allacma fusca]